MTFWQKFWKLVSKRDLLFITLIFAAVLVLSLKEADGKVTVTFSGDAVDITAARYTMNIPYADIAEAELLDLPDRGTAVAGRDDMTLRYGQWTNDTWGEHYICADLAADNCIAVTLHDGQTFVFSRKSSDTTAQLFAQLQEHLSGQAD